MASSTSNATSNVAATLTPSATPSASTATLRAATSPAVHAGHWHEPGTTFDLDVHEFESQERVARFVRLFSGPARASFTEQLERGTRYETMIRTRLRAAGLPEDIYYLALVESGFDPQATSRASAVGMWQFMAATARDVGMRVDFWVDERRDPFRATDGAVRTMKWLRSQFGSMFLAAAAYNGGEGRVSRGLARLATDSARAESDDQAPDDTEHAEGSVTADGRFFALADAGYLRTETSNYVPQLIAALLVAKEPTRYGLVVHAREAFDYDSVRVGPLVPLAAVAEAADASRDRMLELNPHYLRGVTPPGASSYVRVPAGTASATAERLRAMPASSLRAFRQTTTHKRDSYAAIAEREGVSARLVARYNPDVKTARSGKWKGRIVGGQSLRLPTRAAASFARDVTEGDGPSLGPLPAVAESPAAKSTAKSEKKVAAKESTAKESSAKKSPVAKKPSAAKKSPAAKGSGAKKSSSKSSASKSPANKKNAPAKKGRRAHD